MNKFILSVVAAGLSVGVAVAGPGGKNGNGGNGNHSNGSHGGHSNGSHANHGSHMGGKPTGHAPKSNYHQTHGKSFGHGFCYPGKTHSHWTYQCYWPKYGCQAYWCPSTCGYYYWCAPAACYYPISYIQTAPPVQVQVQVAAPVVAAAPLVQTQTQTQTQTQGVGGPPPGIPGLPQ